MFNNFAQIYTMDYLFDLFMVLLPAGMVVLVVQVIMHQYFSDRKRRDELRLKKASKEMIIPIQMQAYERLILFLERISPERLVMRVRKNNMGLQEFQLAMLKSIRSEFEHNLSQQLYVSADVWKLVVVAEEETSKLINLAATRLPENATAMDLATTLIEVANSNENLPTGVAMSALKTEFQNKFKV